jgi:CRISPR-associated protein Csx17
MNEILLAGCTPTPLAHYLKALGVFRLVAEQKDPGVKACWRGERFVLITHLAPKDLTQFLLDEYRPTPVLAPWNGGSGFFPSDNKDGFRPLSLSSATRFLPIADAISTASRVLADLNLTEKPNPDTKPRALMALRARASDEFLAWLDAAVVLSAGEPGYPPLLGTGGNDGRLDFTNNFLQRLVELFDPATGAAVGLASAWLDHALCASPTPKLAQRAIGQFAPGQIGGPNATSGFSTDSRINPWDFVLMLEGALLFVTATSRRLESNQQAILAYPFTVYANSGGSGGMAQADAGAGSSRGEIWMPLWGNPARIDEIRVLLAEGRATLGRRAARDGLDFARAVSRLGTDRGISAFQRYGFMVRNGLAYLATPIARVESRRAPGADLINDLEHGHFLDLLRREARGKEAPASLRRVVAQLENALFALTRPGAGRQAVQRALILVGEVMQSLATSRKGKEAIPVLPSLSPAWVLAANDNAAEFRLALALAGLPSMTAHIAPVAWDRPSRRWQWHPESRRHVWGKGDLTRNLVRISGRRILDAQRPGGTSEPFDSPAPLGARTADVHAFLSEETDDARIASLLQGLVWVRLPEALAQGVPNADNAAPMPLAYRLTKAFFTPASLLRYLDRLPAEGRWALPQEIPRLLAAGQVQKALEVAWRRSRIAGLGWPVGTCPQDAGANGPRLLASLAIPIQPADLARLLPRVADQEPEPAQS